MDRVGFAWMNEEAVDTFQEGLQAKSHTLGIVKRTVYLRTRIGKQEYTCWEWRKRPRGALRMCGVF